VNAPGDELLRQRQREIGIVLRDILRPPQHHIRCRLAAQPSLVAPA
jgi:hypothetical protein